MKKLSLLCLILVFISCKKEEKQAEISKKNYEKIEQLQWLVGSWTNITEEKQSFENWHKTNDSTLKAHSYTIVENDTVFAERVTLQQVDNAVTFTVVAYNQNDNKPVTFRLKPTNNGVFTFENLKHDFPSKISYSNPVKDSIHAWIEGKMDKEPITVDFYYKRAK
ncbi:DUF6265 family protein [Lacinutrix sp. MedPE-SW]|uniref:DUF6265 family protein n=1 Tax=Lacinutrix sp. MedPE-SW TaxID=1860087 RepID=UPI000922CC15|nr:DUF6265 family protein [Lacinutrix sp. MedPE-SW]OIQ23628.1 MAG: hypothetical protein BM549_03420 [Lacinutrix sp. MedPE-SW]